LISKFWGCLLLAAGCASLLSSSAPGSIWWTQRLHLKTLAELTARTRAPLEEQIPVAKGELRATVTSCEDYQKYHGLGYRATNDSELRLLQYLGVDCAALECLRHAAPARVSYLADFRLSPDVLSELPAQFAVAVSPQEERKELRATKRGFGWLAYQPDLKAQWKADALATTGDGMRTTIELYARADFDGDGIDDILVRQDYSAEQGSYAGSRLFLITRQSRHEVLRVLNQYR
jgi:hypothetical protein